MAEKLLEIRKRLMKGEMRISPLQPPKEEDFLFGEKKKIMYSSYFREKTKEDLGEGNFPLIQKMAPLLLRGRELRDPKFLISKLGKRMF